MSRRKFLCKDCKIDTGKIGEHYMLKDSVWYSVYPSQEGMLCINCIEKRLGRKLNKNDFNNSYVNNLNFGVKNCKLVDRLTA